MQTKYILKTVFLFLLAVGFYCAGENFLLSSPKKKTRSSSKLKQEIMQNLASILNLESKSIEIKARVQQEICKCINELAQGDRKSSFSKASRNELEKSLEKLLSIKKDKEEDLSKTINVLNFVKNGCIERSIKK